MKVANRLTYALFTALGACACLAGLPSGAAAATVSGTVEIVHIDSRGGGHGDYDYSLVTASGRQYDLDVSQSQAEEIAPEAKVTVSGTVDGGDSIDVASIDSQTRPLEADAGALGLQDRTVAIVLLNFQNDTSEPRTAAQVRDLVFTGANSANTYYEENSYGTFGFTGRNDPQGDIYGYFTLPIDSTCDYDAIQAAANPIANAAGASLSQYDHVMYMFPANCGWSGLGYLNDPRTLIDISDDISWTRHVIYHELGHNFGGYHASGISCTDGNGTPVALGDNCHIDSYGDPYDVMGNLALRDLSAYHRAQFGWVPNANQETVAGSGTYTLVPAVAPGATGTQSLRLLREYGQAGAPDVYIYMEFRQPAGLWDNFPAWYSAVNGVQFRLAYDHNHVPYNGDDPVLIDGHPETPTITDATVLLGESLYDPTTQSSFTVTAVTPTGATVEIQENAPPPIPPPPPQDDSSTSSTPVAPPDTGTFTGTTGPKRGSAGADYFKGNALANWVVGLGGNDALWGYSGNDRLYGGLGRDRLWGGIGNDRLFGDGGNDRILGEAGNDTITGGQGRDVLSGGAGKDTILARDKSVDVITCGKGRDKVTADRKDKVSRDCESVKRR
jgi:hypothetical protein